MQKIDTKNLLMTICTSYTVVSLGIHLYEMIIGWGDLQNHINGLMMFICTTVSVLVLSLYNILDDWSPVAVIILQYFLATALILGITYVIGRFEEDAQGGYFDMWRSFTIIYTIGAAIYYMDVYLAVKKQNKWLQEIQRQKENIKEKNLD